jgi:phosphoribosylanthranilate isomerase
MKTKICGISDSNTLKYIINHPYPPDYIGFIVNYKKSKRFVELNNLKKLLEIKKKKTKYVAVLVKPTDEDLEKISTLPFDYYQIYDLNNNQIKLIKKKYKINIIVAITVKDKNDVLIYNNYKDVADIFLFDSKGYEKSMSFDHKLIKDLRSNTKIMIAGNIQIDDDLETFNKIADIIDISGGLETAGLKDISKINIFLNKIKQIKDEA